MEGNPDIMLDWLGDNVHESEVLAFGYRFVKLGMEDVRNGLVGEMGIALRRLDQGVTGQPDLSSLIPPGPNLGFEGDLGIPARDCASR